MKYNYLMLSFRVRLEKNLSPGQKKRPETIFLNKSFSGQSAFVTHGGREVKATVQSHDTDEVRMLPSILAHIVPMQLIATV